MVHLEASLHQRLQELVVAEDEYMSTFFRGLLIKELARLDRLSHDDVRALTGEHR